MIRTSALVFVTIMFLYGAAAYVSAEAEAPGIGSAKDLVGTWEISQTKEPGKPYRRGYKGRPFATKGANAFTVIIEYREDGTFRRTARLGSREMVEEGAWSLNGHELRIRPKGKRSEEVMYVRFDKPDEITFVEVYERASDLGMFARFRKLP